jgi:hypothetical protein
MTVVGDLAQCSAAWAPASWRDVLDNYSHGNWRLVELSTNYRTPMEIMAVANALLASASPGSNPTVAIRSSGYPPVRHRVPFGDVASATREAAVALLDEIGDGRLGVIAPSRLLSELSNELSTWLGSDFDVTRCSQRERA